ncbi:hypothetical protein [Streptomyces halstedii]|uniref:hypothetical protein n=1 Tax=Streptomyces halstedii TaxID=1944 RepID=UPI0038307528
MLARALSNLHRFSGQSARAIALRAELSPSYVYRLTAGERPPSWKTVRNYVIACDGEPNDLVDLWNAADEQEQLLPDGAGFDEVLARFQGAVRGLHLAEARPNPEAFVHALPDLAKHEISIMKSLLSTPPARRSGTLSWTATKALTVALHGDSDRIRQQWNALRAAAPRSRLLTQAFG